MAFLETLLIAVLILVAVGIFLSFALSGKDLTQYDLPPGQIATSLSQVSAENQDAINTIKKLRSDVQASSLMSRIPTLRQIMDQGPPGAPMTAQQLDVTITPIDDGQVKGEWVLAPEASTTKRLLYIHGGAFAAGSPTSHRPITGHLSHMTNCAVFAVQYRLMPEHSRLASVKDCQQAYAWILENGPDKKQAPEHLFVAGDSAGGNLTLMLSAWVRDNGLRPFDGVIALSPSTDLTFSSPSFRQNRKSDIMLGPILGLINFIPKPLQLLATLMTSQRHPASPDISPVFGDLGNLPPTLVQSSDCEMLCDDARRWVNKACAQGTDARLQVWPQMLHVWQIFVHALPEAQEAMQEIAHFIEEHSQTSTVNEETVLPSSQTAG